VAPRPVRPPLRVQGVVALGIASSLAEAPRPISISLTSSSASTATRGRARGHSSRRRTPNPPRSPRQSGFLPWTPPLRGRSTSPSSSAPFWARRAASLPASSPSPIPPSPPGRLQLRRLAPPPPHRAPPAFQQPLPVAVAAAPAPPPSLRTASCTLSGLARFPLRPPLLLSPAAGHRAASPRAPNASWMPPTWSMTTTSCVNRPD